MLNSRFLSTILLIGSFLLLWYMYVEKEYKSNILITNYGSVNLGEVYAERVSIKVEIQGFLNDDGKFETVGEVPFNSPMKDIDEFMVESFRILNLDKSNDFKIAYLEAKPKMDMKLKLTTQIKYKSSNFQSEPFDFIIAEKFYDLKKGELLRKSFEKAFQNNSKSTEESITSSLFLTRSENLGILGTK